MSIFKTNKFFRVIKHFILALPLMFVLGVSLYTIVNPNAKDSYYGETINEIQYDVVDSADEFSYNDTYYFRLQKSHNYRFTNANYVISSISEFSTEKTSIVVSTIETSTSYFSLSNNVITFYDTNDTQLGNIDIYYYNVNFRVELLFGVYQTPFEYNDTLTKVVYVEYSYLSNSFTYAMNEFTKLGFGQFDFVSFFNGVFNTNINNVYVRFINDYVNYYLFVEIVYFVPWFFHWFIHFVYDFFDNVKSKINGKKEDD